MKKRTVYSIEHLLEYGLFVQRDDTRLAKQWNSSHWRILLEVAAEAVDEVLHGASKPEDAMEMCGGSDVVSPSYSSWQ